MTDTIQKMIDILNFPIFNTRKIELPEIKNLDGIFFGKNNFAEPINSIQNISADNPQLMQYNVFDFKLLDFLKVVNPHFSYTMPLEIKESVLANILNFFPKEYTECFSDISCINALPETLELDTPPESGCFPAFPEMPDIGEGFSKKMPEIFSLSKEINDFNFENNSYNDFFDYKNTVNKVKNIIEPGITDIIDTNNLTEFNNNQYINSDVVLFNLKNSLNDALTNIINNFNAANKIEIAKSLSSAEKKVNSDDLFKELADSLRLAQEDRTISDRY
ncbi:MAG: hypothetical protein LUE64_03215 [Candidatus Gastranaerophilales bacterium]|nr:hypothetical protein [Candidatus Gastranaerophilales bacterium]